MNYAYVIWKIKNYPWYTTSKYVKDGAKTAVKNALKGLIVLPFAMLAWDYYKSRDVRATA